MSNSWLIAVRGGKFPEKFNMADWLEAWRITMDRLRTSAKRFTDKPGIDNYWRLAERISQIEILEGSLSLARQLTWCGDLKRSDFDDGTIRSMRAARIEEYDVALKDTGVDVWNWLAGLDGRWARDERSWWLRYSSERSECLRVGDRISESGHLLAVGGVKYGGDTAIRSKFLNKARSLGETGFAMDPRDPDAETFMVDIEDAEVREQIWRAMQKSAVSQAHVARLISLRQRIAERFGVDNYVDFLDISSPGLTSRHVGNVFARHLAEIGPEVAQTRQALVENGQVLLRKRGEMATAEHIDEPWNMSRAEWVGDVGQLRDADKGVFPLMRIIKHIIPDILSIGGWTLSAPVRRLCGGKKGVYLYQLHNGKRSAILYFSASMGTTGQDGDAYQAESMCIRNRWAGPGRKTTPVCFIDQNLELDGGCVVSPAHLEYLAHELGHVLHSFATEGETFLEADRVSRMLDEVPSILFEHLARDPETLRSWSDPDGPPAAKRLDYWQRRCQPAKSHLVVHAGTVERAVLDIRVHSHSEAPDLGSLRRRLLAKCGLPNPSRGDRSAYALFDTSEFAGRMASYPVGESLSAALLGSDRSGAHVRDVARTLLGGLIPVIHKPDVARHWRRLFGNSLHGDFSAGLQTIGNDYVRSAKALRKTLNKKTGRRPG